MRNGQNKQRMRNRGGGHNNNNNRRSQNPLTRVYESNGPEIKIRGTASHIAEKYLQLARDAQGSGDPVAAENYYQHAEHYFRIIAAAQEQFRQNQPQPHQRVENELRDDQAEESESEFSGFSEGAGREPQPYPMREPQPYQTREQQPRDQNWRDNRNQQQPAPAAADERAVERLPSFITGSGQQPSYGGFEAGNGGERPNGGERGDRGDRPDRYPHRRRRRHHGGGPRPEGQNAQPAPSDDFGD